MFVKHMSLVLNGLYIGTAVGLTLLMHFVLSAVTRREDDNKGVRYSALRSVNSVLNVTHQECTIDSGARSRLDCHEIPNHRKLF